MRRRVLYDATSRAAAAAVPLLADRFETAELAPEAIAGAAAPTVVLVGEDSRLPPPESRHVRVVGLVNAAAPGPWPGYWYALVPEGSGRAIVARAVENAFADTERAAEVARLDRELSELNAIGIRLSAERNPRQLLETILTKAREITKSDAGSVYLVDEAPDGTRELRFALAQNDSVPVSFRATRLPLTSESVAGHVALTGQILNLADAYVPPSGGPFVPRREPHRRPRERRRPGERGAIRRHALLDGRDDGAPLRRAPARLRQGRRAGAGAGQGQEALPRRARPDPPARRARQARP